jgi:biotin carboxyl carrier protein
MPALAALTILGLLVAPSDQREISFAVRGRSIRPGEIVVLTMRTRKPASALTVHAFGNEYIPYSVSAAAWRVFIGIDLSVTPGTHEVAVHAEPGGVHATYPLVVKARTFRTRSLKVDPDFVTPPPETLARIEREALELEEIWHASAPARLWSGVFVRPVPHQANSAFGTRSIFNGEPRSHHSGADFRSPAGTPIKAPNAGRIVLTGPRYFSGNSVVIDHGLGLFSFFAHLSVITAKTGDVVKKGQIIGRVGATGRVTGPHLHWSVRVGGARVDPLSLLALRGL